MLDDLLGWIPTVTSGHNQLAQDTLANLFAPHYIFITSLFLYVIASSIQSLLPKTC
jgi:hypothetical protein